MLLDPDILRHEVGWTLGVPFAIGGLIWSIYTYKTGVLVSSSTTMLLVTACVVTLMFYNIESIHPLVFLTVCIMFGVLSMISAFSTRLLLFRM